MPLRFFTLLLSMLVIAAPRAADEPSLKDVMRRVGAYVASYGETASVIVATERYVQEASGSDTRETARRLLLSDFAIVKSDPAVGWQGFRDVLEVDGTAVSDRRERLARVLIEGGERDGEARRISDESARYNIGRILRNFNVPTTVLFFFTPANRDRFGFSRKRAGDDGVWEIEFKERSRPTLIRSPEGNSVPSRGTLWVRAADGTVVRTLLRADLPRIAEAPTQRGSGAIDVTYRPVPALGMWLPDTMSENFESTRGRAWSSIKGEAT